MRAIRTLLVDRNRTFLGAAAEFLTGYPRIQLIERARSGAEALEMIARLHPDLVLIDFAMRDIDGFEIARQAKAMKQAPAVILLSLFESKTYRRHAFASGADGVVSKHEFAFRLMPLVSELFAERISDRVKRRTPAGSRHLR